MLELIHTNFDDFKDSTPDAQWFAADKVLLAPAVPFHDGAVEFFGNIGRWTPALQERNEELIERERLMEEAWPDFWDRHADSDDAATKWKEWKSANLPSMTPVSEFAETQKA